MLELEVLHCYRSKGLQFHSLGNGVRALIMNFLISPFEGYFCYDISYKSGPIQGTLEAIYDNILIRDGEQSRCGAKF